MRDRRVGRAREDEGRRTRGEQGEVEHEVAGIDVRRGARDLERHGDIVRLVRDKLGVEMRCAPRVAIAGDVSVER